MTEIRIGIIGYGKIARDQHEPAIAADPSYRLAALVAPQGAPDAAVPVFKDHHAMLAAGGIDAVAICTPAGPRYAIARDCLAAGVDALLEKPPTATLGQIDELAALAGKRERTLFTAWHAQHNTAVSRLRALLANEGLGSMQIVWLENVNKWHPGQQWVWEPGGFGVFDAGINALSIAALIAPMRLMVRNASFTLHRDGQQPIAAMLDFAAEGVEGGLGARFDWRHVDDERWDIGGTTAAGMPFLLSNGGATLSLQGEVVCRPDPAGSEYRAIYAKFADLFQERRSLIDSAPLRLLADANLVARREAAASARQMEP